MSLSSYKTLIEIYDVENDLLFYRITENVFTNGIFSFKFSLLENIIDNKNIYYTIYTHDSSDNLYVEGNYFSIKKFSFEKTTEEEIITKFISSSTKSNIKSSRIISGFLGNDCIYVIFVNSKNSNPYKLYIRKYNYQTSDISSDYEIDSKYTSEYQACLTSCEDVTDVVTADVTNEKTLLILTTKLDLDSTSTFALNTSKTTTFYDTFVTVKYDGKVSTVKDLTPGSSVGQTILEVDDGILDAKTIDLLITARGKQYAVNLKS